MLGLMLTAALAGQIGQCDPQDGPGLRWAPEVRAEARARARAACRAQGASRAVCAYTDAVAVRESSGRPGVRHRLGQDEDGREEHGLGLHGLSLRWHRGKWPEPADPAFCQPEASELVVLELVRRAVVRYGAQDLVAVQSIYAGRWRCYRSGERRWCRATQTRNPRLCAALAARGVDCRARITLRDVGRRVPLGDRADRAALLAAAFKP